MKHTIADVKRMAGHLLADPKRHHAFTHGRNVRGDSVYFNQQMLRDMTQPVCAWCYWGALIHCSLVLGTPEPMFNESEWDVSTIDWDTATTEQRLEMARKLREA